MYSIVDMQCDPAPHETDKEQPPGSRYVRSEVSTGLLVQGPHCTEGKSPLHTKDH